MKPAEGPHVWRAADLAADRSWAFDLAPAEIASLEAGRFDLPRLDEVCAGLERGRGLALVRGLPVARYGEEAATAIFSGIGDALGIAVSQSYRGDRIGHVRDIGEAGRYYTVGGALEMHMDPVDVVGLLCLKKAVRGGESRIASSAAVHNAVLAERPDLVPVLRRGFHYTSRQEDKAAGAPPVTPHRVPVFGEIDGRFAAFLLPIAIRNAEKAGAPLSPLEREALEAVARIAAGPEHACEMDLEPGDMQFLNNRLILHGRADYRDSPDPDRKRHMLRLWLMMPDWPPRPETMTMHARHDRAGGGIAPKTSVATGGRP